MNARINRREFLRLSVMAAVGFVAASCAPAPTPTPPPPTAKPAATAAPATAAPTAKPAATTAPATAVPTAKPAATAAPASRYSEAPMLAELVKQGKLPPVDQRLPRNPKVANCLPPEWLKPEPGKYGGTLRLISPNVQYDNDGYMMHCTPVLNTPGILGDNITPNVFENYKASDDQKEFTFKLREGLKWSDGKPVTTQDIRFTWENVYNNEEIYPSGVPSWLRTGSKADGNPAKFEFLDDFNFKVTFDGPYGGFPVALAIQSWRSYQDLIKPRHYLEQFHKKYADPAKLDALIKENKFETWVQLFNFKDANSWAYMNARGLGMPKLSPWILVEASDQRCVLERNPYYFKVDAAGQQLPYFDRIECTTIRDLEVLALQQFAGGVDYGCETVTMPKLALYKENEAKGGYNLKFGNIHRTAGVAFLNLTYNDESWRKVVRDVRFRRALSIAIDRKEIIDAIYYGYAKPETPLNPHEYDPAKANKLLDEMGMDKRGPDGFRLAPDGKPFVIEFETSSEFYDHVPATELYVQFWKAVGINTTLKVIEASLRGQRLSANELKATTYFEVSTLWYYQAYGQGWWDRLWWVWWTTKGKQGEEPPAEVQTLYRKREQIMEVSPAEGRKVHEECMKIVYDNVFYFVPNVEQKQPRIESKKMGNVMTTEDCFSITQTLSMEQVFYKT